MAGHVILFFFLQMQTCTNAFLSQKIDYYRNTCTVMKHLNYIALAYCEKNISVRNKEYSGTFESRDCFLRQ